jgi:hypothetical protein
MHYLLPDSLAKECAMPEKLDRLIEAAKRVKMSEGEKEEQRRSFAYGNAKIENDLITREMIDRQAELLKESNDG